MDLVYFLDNIITKRSLCSVKTLKFECGCQAEQASWPAYRSKCVRAYILGSNLFPDRIKCHSTISRDFSLEFIKKNSIKESHKLVAQQ